MFEVGDRFSSVEELEEKIKLLRNDCHDDLWKRDSRTIAQTIAAAQKRVTKKSNLNLNLKYYEVFYSKLV